MDRRGDNPPPLFQGKCDDDAKLTVNIAEPLRGSQLISLLLLSLAFQRAEACIQT